MMPSLFIIQENLSTSGTEPKPGQHSSHLSNRGFLASASLGHRNTKCNSSSTSSISHNVHCRPLLGIFGRLYLPSSNNNGKVPPHRRANTLRCPWFTTRLLYYIIMLNFDEVFYRFHSNMVYYTKFVAQHTKVYQPLDCNSAEVSTSLHFFPQTNKIMHAQICS